MSLKIFVQLKDVKLSAKLEAIYYFNYFLLLLSITVIDLIFGVVV